MISNIFIWIACLRDLAKDGGDNRPLCGLRLERLVGDSTGLSVLRFELCKANLTIPFDFVVVDLFSSLRASSLGAAAGLYCTLNERRLFISLH